MTDWKSKVKGKAAEINKSLHKTGGGEVSNLVLSKHEQKLLTLMGEKSYKGDNVQELGFQSQKRKCVSTDTIECTSHQETIGKNVLNIDTGPKMLVPKKLTFIKIPHLSEIKSSQTKYLSENTCLGNSTLNTEENEFLSDINSDDSENLAPTQTAPTDYKTKETNSTPSISTNRRRHILNMATTIENMNNDTLNVLRSMDQNLTKMNSNLESLNLTLNIIAKKL